MMVRCVTPNPSTRARPAYAGSNRVTYPSGSTSVAPGDVGSVHAWHRDGDRWLAWIQHHDPDPDVPWATWGLYVYDRRTIRRRHTPRSRATVIVSASWGPSQIVKTRIRGLGYTVEHVITGDDWHELRIC